MTCGLCRRVFMAVPCKRCGASKGAKCKIRSGQLAAHCHMIRYKVWRDLVPEPRLQRRLEKARKRV